MTEDPPEDITQHAAFRATAEAASGWNGSHAIYVHDGHRGEPCPEPYRSQLQALREAAAARAALHRPA